MAPYLEGVDDGHGAVVGVLRGGSQRPRGGVHLCTRRSPGHLTHHIRGHTRRTSATHQSHLSNPTLTPEQLACHT
eukprot:559478-Pyramimonas_sp.AAC.1